MEDIRDRLGEYKYSFFINLQNYLDTELHFFGSIKRNDFFENASDIDIIIVTDNVKSILFKAQNYLNIDKSTVQKIFQQYSVHDKGIITGYKIKYENKDEGISFDLLIYDEIYRKDVIKNIDDINNLPLYMVIILCIIKILYYKLHFISKSMYLYLKSSLFFCYFNKEFYYYKKENSILIMVDNF
jgi:predicted nucleotidyltransferase